MYQVYKQVWIHGNPVLQFVAELATESEAKQKALRLKGLVKHNGQTFYDFRS